MLKSPKIYYQYIYNSVHFIKSVDLLKVVDSNTDDTDFLYFE